MIANPHVQIVWWINGTQEQYRITGKAHIVPAPGHELHTPISALSEGQKYDWEAKRLEVFKNTSPFLKGSYCRAVSGSRLESGRAESENWPLELEEPKPGDTKGKRLWGNGAFQPCAGRYRAAGGGLCRADTCAESTH
ncbi:hypothetical protein B0H16DRAFT_1721321 [Mycena metata]|uniref:Uncharacterized protein n=1 Tax=Mycena metata TaxID=1033252 RepID=A0AAD7NFF0_9AGAR|nr:hypothetical protein B0H16DRAFT_1721321 [Mycena metata]